MQPTAEALSKLLLTLYAAPMRPELWGDFLSDFTGTLGLPGAAILHQDLAEKRYGFSVTSGIDPAAQKIYAEYYGQTDPFRPRLLTKHEGELALADDLCPQHLLLKTELYGDYLTKYGFTLYCSMATIKQPATCEFISIYRGLRSKEPSPETRSAIELVIPHIRTALHLRHQLRDVDVTAANFIETINSLKVGIVLLNQLGECVFVSAKAESFFKKEKTFGIRRSRLSAEQATEHRSLCQLIERAIAVARGKTTKPCGTMSISRSNNSSIWISVISLSPRAPLAELATLKTAVAAVLIRDPQEEIVSLPKILMITHGLTPAEARLATQLFQGLTLTQAAETNRVSIGTIRTQLKAVFAKIRVRRQTEMLRLFADLVNTGVAL